MAKPVLWFWSVTVNYVLILTFHTIHGVKTYRKWYLEDRYPASVHQGVATEGVLCRNQPCVEHLAEYNKRAFLHRNLRELDHTNGYCHSQKVLRSPTEEWKKQPSMLSLSAVQKYKAPDLHSALLSERTIFIGMPIQNVVSNLVISQLLYLDNASQKPIKIYINSTADIVTDNPRSRSEIDALSIVDVMRYVKSEVITVNLGKAYGSAALVLAAGAPGKRFVLPRSFTALRQSSVSLEMMQAEDISIYSKEILRARKAFVLELAKYCAKSEVAVLETVQHGCYLDAQQTIAYGIADKVLSESGME